jgi:hypothetical protein
MSHDNVRFEEEDTDEELPACDNCGESNCDGMCAYREVDPLEGDTEPTGGFRVGSINPNYRRGRLFSPPHL